MGHCVGAEDFQRLLAEQLSTAERKILDAHVDRCPACQQRLVQILEGDNEGSSDLDWQRLCQASPETTPPSMEDLLRRLKDQLPSSTPTPAGTWNPAVRADILFPAPPTVKGPLGRLECYHIMAERGRGAFGVVFQAYDEQLQSTVAVKVLKPELAANPTDRTRFEGEARKAAAIRHDHIVTIHRVGHTPGFPLPYFVMEYVDGESLSDRLRRQGMLAAREAAELARQVAQGLAAAHARGLVHRDINPANILVEQASGRAKITDFGLARSLALRTERLTQSGGIVGTPPYMSPEQITAAERVDPRSDVYSLGVVLYELLTGERPFRGQPHLILHQVVHEEPRPPQKLNDAIPRDVETITLKCLAKEPGRRYQTAQALADDLERWLQGRPIQARPVSRGERLWLWCRRTPVIAGLSAAVLLLLMLVAVVALGGYVQTVRALNRERRLNYAASMRLMQVAWENHDIVRVKEALAETADFPERGFEWFYWQRLCRVEHLTLMGHRGGLTGMAFSADGRRLATSGADGTARLWDAKSGEELRCLRGHQGKVTAVAFTPDGQLVTGSTDGTARVWDAADGREMCLLQEPNTGPIRALAVIRGGAQVATASDDGTVRIWDADSGQVLRSLTGKGVSAVAATADGRWLVARGEDSKTRVWDVECGQSYLLEDAAEATSLAMSADGLLIVAGWAGTVKLWDVTTRRCLRTLDEITGMIKSVALTADGKRAMAGYWDGTAKVWDTASGREVLSLMGHRRWVVGVAFSPDGQRLATAGLDGTARVWDISSGRGTRTLKGHTGPVNSIAVTPDGQRIITAGRDGTVRLWDPVSGQELRKFVGHSGCVWSVAVTPNGQRIVTGGQDGTAKIWDLASGREVLQLRGHTERVTAVAVSSDGQRIITGSCDGTARIWDAHNGCEKLQVPAGQLCSVAVTPDGKRIVTGGWDGTARLWDAQSGRELRKFEGHTGNVESAVVIPGTQRLVTGGLDGTAAVWDMESGLPLFWLKGHTGPIRPVAVTPDGQRIVTGGNDRIVRVWDAQSGRELLVLQGHTGRVVSVAVAPNGQWIVAGGEDGSVKIWEAASPDRVVLWARQEAKAERKRAAWHKHSGSEPGFVQDWLVLAPLQLKDGEKAYQGLEREQLRNEAGLRPREGDPEPVDGRELTWQAYRGEGSISNRIVGKQSDHSVAYAVCYVVSAAEREQLLLQVGSEATAAKVYLNGQEVYKDSQPHALIALNPIGPITLHKGTNVLVLKVVNSPYGWTGCARFVDLDDNPAKGLAYSLTPE